MVIDVFLIIILAIAVVYDIRFRRIPNYLIVIGLIFALVSGFYYGCNSLIFSLKGLAAGIALLFIPFAMGGVGAGDVKLLGIIGALKGAVFVVNTFIWMAIWGGFIALFYLVRRKQVAETLRRLCGSITLIPLGLGNFARGLNREEFSVYYPYGVPIGLGVITTYLKGWCI